jgi:hypothetical protein
MSKRLVDSRALVDGYSDRSQQTQLPESGEKVAAVSC